MVKLEELTETDPGPESVPVALSGCAPLESMRRFVNVATPATAALVAVPCNEPPPELIAAVTLIVESAPVVTGFPNASSTFTTGWVPNAEPGAAERRVGEEGGSRRWPVR